MGRYILLKLKSIRLLFLHIVIVSVLALEKSVDCLFCLGYFIPIDSFFSPDEYK